MHGVQVAIISVLIGFTILLHNLATSDNFDAAARHVLDTVTWSVGVGTAVNAFCGLGTYAFRAKTEVEPGTEMAVCAPYGLVFAAIAVRVHIFSTGGYGAQEWNYVMNAPSIVSRAVEDGVVGRVLGRK
jgi:cytochrome bd-type quinol oxidase subunit 2